MSKFNLHAFGVFRLFFGDWSRAQQENLFSGNFLFLELIFVKNIPWCNQHLFQHWIYMRPHYWVQLKSNIGKTMSLESGSTILVSFLFCLQNCFNGTKTPKKRRKRDEIVPTIFMQIFAFYTCKRCTRATILAISPNNYWREKVCSV